MTSPNLTEQILKQALTKSNLWGKEQELAFPLITKSGVNKQGKTIRYFFNYSDSPKAIKYLYKSGTELLSNQAIAENNAMTLEAWGVKIVEEN
jgi:beta-galactosidase